MSTYNRFTLTRQAMNILRNQAIQRATDTKREVGHAINTLKKINIPPTEVQELVSRFSAVRTLAGIPQNIIRDLIDGFQHYEDNHSLRYAFVGKAAITTTSSAIENLTSIIDNKATEIRQFERQGIPRTGAPKTWKKLRKFFINFHTSPNSNSEITRPN